MINSHSERSVPELDDLESLFVNNADLESIRTYLSRFNPIKTMGMERMEIRHSAILAWLLDPQESHGLGDRFLKAFLAEALRGHDFDTQPSALDVSQADMMDADVRREWQYIDLLILSPRNRWIFIIENKFDSKQHGEQLRRYMETVSASFLRGGNYDVARGVFLTLWEEEPEDERYAPIEYSTICELLGQVAMNGSTPLKSEVNTFLIHYLEVIREATDMSTERREIEKIARQLYRAHRATLNFIVKYGKSTEFSLACEMVFGTDIDYLEMRKLGDVEFLYIYSDTEYFCILPNKWFKALGGDEYWWHGCENWWSGHPVALWLELNEYGNGTGGQISLFAAVGPLTDHQFRKSLIEDISAVANENLLANIVFRKNAIDEGRKYSKFLKNNSIEINDIHDHEEIYGAMIDLLNRFEPEIEAVAEVFPKFREYGQDEESK